MLSTKSRPKTIRIKSDQIQFPNQCVVCLQPAAQTYTVERTLVYGRTSRLVRLPVPMCQAHFDLASSKNPTERAMNIAGLIAGGTIGLASGAALFIWWMNTNQGNVFLNIFLALFLALGFFLICWVLTSFFIAPLFAGPEVKKVRSAVKIDAFWPGDQTLQLTFANEQVG